MLDFFGDDLEPSQLIPLIPLRPLGPRRKGEPLGRTRGLTQPAARIGYCGFTTHDQDRLPTPNAHLGFVLDILEPRLEAIRRVMLEQSLNWMITFFEGNRAGQYLADLDQEFLQRAASLDLPIYREQEMPPSIPH